MPTSYSLYPREEKREKGEKGGRACINPLEEKKKKGGKT